MKGFLDTSIVLDTLDRNVCSNVFASMTLGLEREWCISPLVRMESLVRVLTENDLLGFARAEVFLGLMTSLPLIDAVFDRAAYIRAQTGLKSLDALHVATALEHGCGELWTADARLARAVVSGLAIRLVS